MPYSDLIETRFSIFLNMYYHGFQTWWISWALYLKFAFTLRNKWPIEAAVCIYSPKKVFLKFQKFHRKIPALESLFNKVADLPRVQHRCFPVKFANFKEHLFYRTPPVTASWPSCCCIGRRISLRHHVELRSSVF